MTFKRILEMCEKHGFLKKITSPNSAVSQDLIRLGPTGALLQENLKSEWLNNMVTDRDVSVFLSNNSFVEAYEYAKEVCQERLPFGVTEIVEDVIENRETSNGNNVNVNLDEKSTKNHVETYNFDRYFLESRKFSLKSTVFVAPSSSVQFFHQWQRQRRMWWRKFSAAPGRYLLTDIQTDGNGSQSVEIKASYPWNSQHVESLVLNTSNNCGLTPEQLQVKDGRKKVQAHYVTSNISLSSMVLNTICDAYDEPLFQGEPRPILRFHRKLAPYKVSFAVSATQSTSSEELGQLALYLCKQLRNNHVSSLLVPGATRNTLENQWRQYDQLGIPYNILLNENTLRNGIILLRSRDTTLKEQVHVTNLPTYIEQLFKNY